VQVNEPKDLATIYCENGEEVQSFTENHLLKKLGLTTTNMGELKNLMMPRHLKFVANMLGIEDEEIKMDLETVPMQPAVGSAPVSGGQLSISSQGSLG
jgi:hypothetical protein